MVDSVLQICPWEPPTSGWTVRVKLLRREIARRGARCEILDVGPSRRLRRPGCIPVDGGVDFLRKTLGFCRQGSAVHGHINGEYFRGQLLTLAAFLIATGFRTRRIVTFHAGVDQPFLSGWKKVATAPVWKTIFALAHVVVCNDAAVKRAIASGKTSKFVAIPAFSRQYVEYRPTELDPELQRFLVSRAPRISTYLCFRPGFFTEVVLDALARLVSRYPEVGLVVVGTGDDLEAFRDEVARRGLTRCVHLAGDLGHDDFMTLLSGSDVHVRTPVTDGVSATVLEALSLRTPVVASDNGNRPVGTLLYPAGDAAALARCVESVVADRPAAVAAIPELEIRDTASEEVDRILGLTVPSSSAEPSACAE